MRDQLGEFADALNETRELQVFFFSPYFSTAEKVDGLDRTVSDADPAVVNFLKLLIENHRMPVIFRVRREFDQLWQEENKLLPVQVTSAVELDQATVTQIGDRIAQQTGRKVDLSATRGARRPRRSRGPGRQLHPGRLDPQPPRTTSQAGGPRVARRPLRSLRADQARRDHQHPQVPHRGPRRRSGRPDRGRHRPLGRRRHRPHPWPRELHGLRDARAPARRDRPRAQPRVRQRRRRALRPVGARSSRATRSSARTACSRSRSATRCSAASSPRSASRSTARARSTPRDPPGRVQGPRRRPAPAGQGADADRHQGRSTR